jgi:hypothetical protein
LTRGTHVTEPGAKESNYAYNLSSEQRVTINLTGYWVAEMDNNTAYAFHILQPGAYTVEVVDIFNQTAIAYFSVG